MLEYENREDRWRRRTKEQFEELGRFVQAFEHMVDATRKQLWFMIQTPGRPADRTRIILNHHNLTAQPLFDMFRAVATSIIVDPAYGFTDEEKDVGRAVLKRTPTRYQGIVRNRNEILHGTWYIGAASAEQSDFPEMHVAKFKVSASGLEQADTPENARGLRAIRHVCEEIGDVVFFFSAHLTAKYMSFKETFYLDGKDWHSTKKVSRLPDDL